MVEYAAKDDINGLLAPLAGFVLCVSGLNAEDRCALPPKSLYIINIYIIHRQPLLLCSADGGNFPSRSSF